jgi:hypothetical protein
MALGLAKGISADQQLEKLDHDKHHIDTLKSMYPDLHTYRDANNSLAYFSKSIHSATDGVEFAVTNTGYNSNIHGANPFKNVNISCKHCDGNVKIYTLPSHIPLFLYHGSSYGPDKDSIFHVMAYEDFFKIYGISQDVIGKSHMYILGWIEEFSKKSTTDKLDLTYINQSLKKLLPFM